MLRFDKTKYLSLLFKFILYASFRNILWESEVLLFLEFINIFLVSILFCNFIEFIKLWHTSLVTSFCQYKEYMIWVVEFNKFSDVLPAFTCASSIRNVWSIFLRVSILINLPFCCSLKLRIFSTILTTFLDFCFQEFLLC